jgi:hypothetical protein
MWSHLLDEFDPSKCSSNNNVIDECLCSYRFLEQLLPSKLCSPLLWRLAHHLNKRTGCPRSLLWWCYNRRPARLAVIVHVLPVCGCVSLLSLPFVL